MQSYHHPALQPVAPSVIITPHFVRAAASFDFAEDAAPPIPVSQAGETKDTSKTVKNDEKKTRKKNKDARARERDAQAQPARAATPALGESIKQHTSAPRKTAQAGKGKDVGAGGDGRIESSPSPKKQSKLVIKKWHRTEDIENKAIEQDPTRESSTSGCCLVNCTERHKYYAAGWRALRRMESEQPLMKLQRPRSQSPPSPFASRSS
jgi:protein-serine/threonine kinase